MQAFSLCGLRRFLARATIGAGVVLACLSAAPVLAGDSRVLDDFERASAWRVITSEGVNLSIETDTNGASKGDAPAGKCLRIEYDFTRGSGYGIVRKEFDPPLRLAENYRFSYMIRGDGPSNTVEFKLIDTTGDNVWWVNQQNVEFPKVWQAVRLPKRKIEFAWGPAGSKVPLKEVKSLEFAITSYNGGKGSVWLDELMFEELPVAGVPAGAAKVRVSSTAAGVSVPTELGRDGACAWRSGAATQDATPSMTIDFGAVREFGGLVIEWDEARPCRSYDVLMSKDGHSFEKFDDGSSESVREGDGGRDYLMLPDAAARMVKIACRSEGVSDGGVWLKSVRVMALEFGDAKNELMKTVAQDAVKDGPGGRGRYPRQFLNEAVYWTIAGAPGDDKEVLFSEDGTIEVEKKAFSIEPFVVDLTKDAAGERGTAKNRLWSWDSAKLSQSLTDGYLPIPRVIREMDGLSLSIAAGVDGVRGASTLLARYTLTNTGASERRGTMILAIRPFQVNPVYQWLNTHGGVGRITNIGMSDVGVSVDGVTVQALVPAANFGAVRFEQGEIVEHIARGKLPSAQAAEDASGLASGAMAWSFALKAGESMMWPVAVGLNGQASGFSPPEVVEERVEPFERRWAANIAEWRAQLERVKIWLPREAQRMVESVRANLAYILINRDGASIQPGSRSYERSWIRDGSLTSAALLSFGHAREAEEFADWFGPYQYDNGKVPCCVDRRGPDPVSEHDSHGQYIWLVLNVFRHTGDSDFLARHYPRVLKAVEYIQALRSERSTPEYRNAQGLEHAKFGMMPESISHEGYSAKPMHSYWDAYFASRGLSDAVSIARLMGDQGAARRLERIIEDFNKDLVNSVTLAMREKGIDYLPGCVELGDFDATSTTVALFPCSLRGVLPEDALQRTFEKYWEFFQARAGGTRDWQDYTPYEHRTAGSMIMLGHRDRAHEIWKWFFEHQRPAGFRHWAEVVWKDERLARFVGDMPHTWVGSDFINAFRTMFVYERHDGGAVIGAGLPRSWASEGASVDGLLTPWGTLSVAMSGTERSVKYEVGRLTAPPGGVWLAPDKADMIVTASDESGPLAVGADGLIHLRTTPTRVEIQYKD